MKTVYYKKPIQRHSLLQCQEFWIFVGFILFTLVVIFAPQDTHAATIDLFISEYVEGSSYNKAIEIYNGTGNTISLSTYSLLIYYNGNSSAGSTITLSGTLSSGNVYIIAHSSASSTILNKANLKTSSLSFNGNDAVVLKKGSTIVDSIGQIGYDPGTAWGSGSITTCDHTLVRKSSISFGDTNPNNSDSPLLEWDGYAQDTFGYLGFHNMSDGTSTPTPTVRVTPTSRPNTPTPTRQGLTVTPTSTPVITGTPTPTGTYNYYFGQFHSHTSYSDGQGTPDQAYSYARNTGHADFFSITDHSHYFDNYSDWTKSTEWASLKQAADRNNVDGQFVAIAGFEMTWSNGTGHMNTFNTDWFESRYNTSMDLPTYYNRIAADSGSISQWNHPGTTFGDFSGFSYYSAATDHVIKLIEVANGEGAPGSSNYYPSYNYYTASLDKGWHVAPSNNQDNHNTNWVTANDCRTVVLAPSLTRANIFDGVRNLRVYATEDKDLRIMYQINGVVMGSTLAQPTILNFTISAQDAESADTISKIEIVVDGGTIIASNSFSSNSANWSFQLPSQFKYYYVKVTEADGNIAVTAPIWTGR